MPQGLPAPHFCMLRPYVSVLNGRTDLTKAAVLVRGVGGGQLAGRHPAGCMLAAAASGRRQALWAIALDPCGVPAPRLIPWAPIRAPWTPARSTRGGLFTSWLTAGTSDHPARHKGSIRSLRGSSGMEGGEAGGGDGGGGSGAAASRQCYVPVSHELQPSAPFLYIWPHSAQFYLQLLSIGQQLLLLRVSPAHVKGLEAAGAGESLAGARQGLKESMSCTLPAIESWAGGIMRYIGVALMSCSALCLCRFAGACLFTAPPLHLRRLQTDWI